ncbi:MAG TPA: hypothetical protein VFX12_10815 [Vicinamibacterales bacterium]|nr:hypothetical protein [Vicinamibacterales bacterium]
MTPDVWYEARRSACAARRDAEDLRSLRVSRLRLVAFLGGVAMAVWAGEGGGWPAAAVAAALFVVYGVLVGVHSRVDHARDQAQAARDVNVRGIARLGRDWDALPQIPPPPEVDLDRHPFARDIDLFGRASLAQWLGRTATPAGAARLADWLLAPADAPTIAQRQTAIRDLAARALWRETLAAEGALAPASSDAIERFLVWAESSQSSIPATRLSIVWGTTILIWVLIVAQYTGLVAGPWWVYPMMAGLIAWYAAGKKIQAALNRIGVGQAALERYVGMLQLACDEPWEAPLLRGLHQRLAGGPGAAPDRFRQLGRIVGWSELRVTSALLHTPIQAVTLWDFHVLLALERWRAACGVAVRGWIDALAELDALAVLSAVHHDCPAWAVPAFDDASRVLTAQALAHPLIPDVQRVANDVTLGPPGTLLLITGSNMSGKSTLLRAIGINIVLAQAGAPVCAAGLTLPPCDLRASIRIQDSLELGVSYFMAALDRLKRIVDAAERREPDRVVLYLLDEVLQGTNSVERSLAVRAIARHLLRAGAIGAMTTHDLSLAQEEPLASAAHLAHFTEQVLPDGRMTFDYRLRDGIATSRNAIRLMQLMGIDAD